MSIVISEMHAAGSPAALNEEWFVAENRGEKPFSTAGCTVSVGRGGKGARLRPMGTLDPGFTLAPGDKVRLITGNPGKKAHGPAPAEEPGLRNYQLFLGSRLFASTGDIVALSLKQHELARATFDPSAKAGVAASKNGV